MPDPKITEAPRPNGPGLFACPEKPMLATKSTDCDVTITDRPEVLALT